MISKVNRARSELHSDLVIGLKIRSRESSSENLYKLHAQSPSYSVTESSALASRAHLVPSLVAVRPAFLPLRHAHALLDTPYFLESLKFDEVFGPASYTRNRQMSMKSKLKSSSLSVSSGLNLHEEHSSKGTLKTTEQIFSFEFISGLKRIKSEDGLSMRSLQGVSESGKTDAVAVLSGHSPSGCNYSILPLLGFKSRQFDEYWNEKSGMDERSSNNAAHSIGYSITLKTLIYLMS